MLFYRGGGGGQFFDFPSRTAAYLDKLDGKNTPNYTVSLDKAFELKKIVKASLFTRRNSNNYIFKGKDAVEMKRLFLEAAKIVAEKWRSDPGKLNGRHFMNFRRELESLSSLAYFHKLDKTFVSAKEIQDIAVEVAEALRIYIGQSNTDLTKVDHVTLSYAFGQIAFVYQMANLKRARV